MHIIYKFICYNNYKQILRGKIMVTEQRSYNMSRIKSKDTSIELKVRKYLFHKGYRYQKNVDTLPGKPDIYISKYNVAIFINGCFRLFETRSKKSWEKS